MLQLLEHEGWFIIIIHYTCLIFVAPCSPFFRQWSWEPLQNLSSKWKYTCSAVFLTLQRLLLVISRGVTEELYYFPVFQFQMVPALLPLFSKLSFLAGSLTIHLNVKRVLSPDDQLQEKVAREQLQLWRELAVVGK